VKDGREDHRLDDGKPVCLRVKERAGVAAQNRDVLLAVPLG
jgi:hypothetical protein